MSLRAELRAAWLLMRPAQWPILTAQLAVGLVLAAGPGGPYGNHGLSLVTAWLAWVVMLNGGTLAFNSFYDRDTGPVAYLPHPPAPPPWLGTAAVGWMLAGVVLGMLTVSVAFGAVTGGCVALSWLYSHPAARWKSRPGLDLLVNILGYGAGTTAAGILAGLAASSLPPVSGRPLVWIVVAFGLLFGSFYPLTQIYQHADDLRRGDRTLATALGVARALDLGLVLGTAAGAAMLRGLFLHGAQRGAAAAMLPLAVWLLHLLWLRLTCRGRDTRGWEKAMYRGLALWAAVDAGLVVSWLTGS